MTRKRSAREVLLDIAEMADLMNPNTGTINYSAFSKRTGIPHPTLIRIMRGGDDHVLSARTAQKLIDAFQLTFAQVQGDAPIRRKDKRKKFEPTESDLALLQRIRSLPAARQQDILTIIELAEAQERSKR